MKTPEGTRALWDERTKLQTPWAKTSRRSSQMPRE